MAEQTLYQRLAAPFSKTFSKKGLEYITGAQCIGRLNEELGVDGWDFVVVERQHNTDTDEILVYGRLTARINGQAVVKEQFGGQKINRTRSEEVIELANDVKGATTDCLKKAASLLGVGLYLYPGDDADPPSRVMHVPPTPQEQARAEAAVNGEQAEREPIDRPALEASWAVIVEEAEKHQLKDWEYAKSLKASEMDDERLARSVRVMGQRVEEAKAAKVATV